MIGADRSRISCTILQCAPARSRLGGGWTLVTDDGIPPDLVERFEAAGVTVTTA